MTAPRKAWGIDVGVEIDVTHFNPDIRNSTLELDASYFGLNILARLPMGVTSDLPNGRWFPYIGLGGGGQRLAMEAPGTNEGRNTAPAFQGLGGINVFLNRHFAVFAEGKFIYASHTKNWKVRVFRLSLISERFMGLVDCRSISDVCLDERMGCHTPMRSSIFLASSINSTHG